jgi:hypothetical protein
MPNFGKINLQDANLALNPEFERQKWVGKGKR